MQRSRGCRGQNKEHALEVNKGSCAVYIKSIGLFFWINFDYWDVAMFINKVVINWTNGPEFYLGHMREKEITQSRFQSLLA